MYTEEFEGFDEEGKGPRTYVSNFSQQDAERLARENEKLKKNLEKEKFFNKLLDQELKEVKAETTPRHEADYQPRGGGISKGAFYALLFLSIIMAGFIFYTLYYNKQYNLFGGSSPSVASQAVENGSDAGEQIAELITRPGASTPPPSASVNDSVPNIIGSNNNNTAGTSKTNDAIKKPAAASSTQNDYNEAEVEAAIKEPVTAVKKPAATSQSKNTNIPAPATANTRPAPTATSTPPTEQAVAGPEPPSRPVIARYKVTSKANFYNGPDENTLRSAFISAGPNKFVDALEDKNGFIYVEYVNDHGMLSKGWLSKTDLTKAE